MSSIRVVYHGYVTIFFVYNIFCFLLSDFLSTLLHMEATLLAEKDVSLKLSISMQHKQSCVYVKSIGLNGN